MSSELMITFTDISLILAHKDSTDEASSMYINLTMDTGNFGELLKEEFVDTEDIQNLIKSGYREYLRSWDNSVTITKVVSTARELITKILSVLYYYHKLYTRR